MNSFYISLILFIVLNCSCSVFDVKSQSYTRYSNRLEKQINSDGWLIMIYMSATGTLEEESIMDLNNIKLGYEELSDNKDVDIVVLYDRGPGYSDANGDLTGSYLYSYDSSGFKIIDRVEGWRDSSDQEESMGEIVTLEHFLSWSKSRYPRENEALILWNHGGGVGGVTPNETRAICWDIEDANSETSEVLYIDEIQGLLASIYNENNRLDILGFDACYMGMIEILYEFRDVVEYVVASSAAETGGWTYQSFISEIDRYSLAEDISVDIVNDYYIFSQENNLQNTLAAYYVPAVKLMVNKLNLLFDLLIDMDDAGLLDIRNEISTYYSTDSVLETLMYPYINLFDFIDKLSIKPELIDITNELKGDYSSLVSQSFDLFNDSLVNQWSSISLFFPLNSDIYESCWWYTGIDTGTYGNIDFCNDTSWTLLLEKWYEVGN